VEEILSLLGSMPETKAKSRVNIAARQLKNVSTEYQRRKWLSFLSGVAGLPSFSG